MHAGLTFDGVVERLGTALAGPLPGASAHEILAPRPRREWPAGFDPARIRQAAGLLLLFPDGHQAHLVLTVRTGSLVRHGGQVSLPGGAIEPGETLEQAALREAHEEIGLLPEGVRILGPLTPLDIPVSGFRLHPVVASIGARPVLTPAAGEVARILDVPVHELAEQSRLVSVRRVRDGRAMTVPLFQLGRDEVWGATAMVLAELLVLLGWNGNRRLT